MDGSVRKASRAAERAVRDIFPSSRVYEIFASSSAISIRSK